MNYIVPARTGMQADLFLSFGKNCHEACEPRSFQRLSSHQSEGKTDHTAIKLVNFNSKHGCFTLRVGAVSQDLLALQARVHESSQHIIQGITRCRDEVSRRVDSAIDGLYAAEGSSRSLKHQITRAGRGQFKELTCHQLREIIIAIQTAIKDRDFVAKQTARLGKVERELQHYFQTQLTSILGETLQKSQLGDSMLSEEEDRNKLFSLNQSRIAHRSYLSSSSDVSTDASELTGLRGLLNQQLLQQPARNEAQYPGRNEPRTQQPGRNMLKKQGHKQQSTGEFMDPSLDIVEEEYGSENIYASNQSRGAHKVVKLYRLKKPGPPNLKKQPPQDDSQPSSASTAHLGSIFTRNRALASQASFIQVHAENSASSRQTEAEGPSLDVGPGAGLATLMGSGDTLMRSGYTLVKSGDTLMGSRDTFVKSGDTLVKSGDTLVRPGDTFVKSEDTLMRSRDTLMRSGDTLVKQGELLSSDEQNEEKLNQTLLQIQQQMVTKQQPRSESQFSSYLTIEQLENHSQEIKGFSIRVQLHKIIYYSVLRKHIPKIKFIAGDSTGFGVFFTNFCPGMQVGTVLDLVNCELHMYRGSLEVINTRNFRILKQNSEGIRDNMEGVRLNKVLAPDLYYPLPDVRCVLIRYAAEKLRVEKRFRVPRMYVKVVAVVYEERNRVFCQVGDSSGLILCYLKKGRVKSIREGDVVQLQNVLCVRGVEKTGNTFMQGEIIYLDCEDEKAHVLPHRFDFLDVSHDIMTID